MLFDIVNATLIRSFYYFKYVIKNQVNLFGPGGPFGPDPSLILTPIGSILTTPSFLESIFYAVPKQRKTIERRLKARFGDDNWGPHGSKLLKRRNDIITCETCGNYREKFRLCLHCFNRVEEESLSIKEAIAKQYGLSPVDKPHEINYKDDPKHQNIDKILIEVDKERPVWFNKKLLQRANEVIPETSVIPTDKTN